MADRYWVGGTASWDGTAGTKWAATDGGAGGSSVPTSADDVFFTAKPASTWQASTAYVLTNFVSPVTGNGFCYECTTAGTTGVAEPTWPTTVGNTVASGTAVFTCRAATCTIAAGNTGAKSINCTGFTGTITGTANITVSGSITLVAGMTYTHTGTVTIDGTATLTTAGKTFSGVTVNGTGITVTLGDALNTASRNLVVTQGTFDTANYNVTVSVFNSTNTNTRTINLGSSTVTVSSLFPWEFQINTNLTFNAGTSQINLTNSGPTLASDSGLTYYDVSFTNTGTGSRVISGANTFNNLTLAVTATGLTQLSLLANQTVNGTFTCAGASSIARGFVRSGTIGTTRTITANAISADDCDFRDITIAGSAAGSSPTRAGDCGGNSGITFPAPKTVYWNIAGTLAWNATGWALTNNGTPAANNFPLAQDTATFTDSGTAGTVNLSSYNIGAIDASTRTLAMTLGHTNTATLYGSYTLGSGVTITGASASTFSGRSTMTFTSAGKTITFPITVDAPSSTFQLGDEFNGASSITHTRGTFNTQNNNLTCTSFSSDNSNTRTITLGSSLITLSTSGTTVWNLATTTGLTFNVNTANITLSNTSANARTFAGGGLTYNKLTIGGATGTSTLTINGANTFSELASTKTVAHTISFGANQTITTWSVTGSSGNVVTVQSTLSNSPRTLTITNRTSGIDWLDVDNITAPLTPVTFYAGSNTRLFRNVQGVAAIAPVTNEYIYVLTTGTSWTVPANWNNSNNEIHLFAGGGGGSSGRYSNPNGSGGSGGGGGGYTKATNVTLSGSVSYAIGAGGFAGGSTGSGNNGSNGGNTTFNSGAYTTTGGGGGISTTTSSTGGAAGTGSTNNGGVGGQGSLSTVANTGNGSGGGGGPGGPLGVGGNGGNGFSSTTQANVAGGGGGGNGGGGNGGNASSATGGTGGNNNAGLGGGAANTLGFNGGGNGGTATAALSFASSGIDIANAGMGGGGGSGGGAQAGGNSGFYGSGGSGGGLNTANAIRAGGSGGQGAIIIWYSAGAAPASNGNFFFLFG